MIADGALPAVLSNPFLLKITLIVSRASSAAPRFLRVPSNRWGVRVRALDAGVADGVQSQRISLSLHRHPLASFAEPYDPDHRPGAIKAALEVIKIKAGSAASRDRERRIARSSAPEPDRRGWKPPTERHQQQLIWPRPPAAILRPPHLLIHVLTDRPTLSPHDRRHELRQHFRHKLDLSDLQLAGESSLQRRFADMRTTAVADVLADHVLGVTVGNEKLNECPVFVGRHEARHPALMRFFCLAHAVPLHRAPVTNRCQWRPQFQPLCKIRHAGLAAS